MQKSKQNNSAKLQQKYIELQFLMQNLKQMQQQSQIAEQQFLELEMLKENLANFSEFNSGANSFSLIGSGIFAESQLKDTKNVIVKISSDIAVRKTVPEASELVVRQLKEIEKILINFEHQIQEHSQTIQKTEAELQELAKS